MNHLIGHHLLERGYRLTAQFTTSDEADQFLSGLPAEQLSLCTPVIVNPGGLADIQQMVTNAAQSMGELGVFIQGNDWLDETQLMENDPVSFAEVMEQRFRQLFLYSRAGGNVMARKKRGQLIFPLLTDTLYYENYPSSPVYNHGVLALVKSLAKEMSPFRISVNALTFGYYRNDQATPEQWQADRKKLEIYALKPSIPDVESLVKGIDMLLDYGHGLSGQNLHWGFGVDTIQ
jgi:NAD(P)-dependent dehydrogenase (short-subunit alcohol dehydrogenase family)